MNKGVKKMLKKYIKLIIYAIVMFLISSLPTSARLMNLPDFIEQVNKVDSNAGYVYIIGKYAFTSTHELTTSDVMLGARTINIASSDGFTKNDPIYDKMAIQSITHKYNPETLEDMGWVPDEPILGTTKLLLDDTHYIDLEYINYEKIPDKTYFEISTSGETEDLKAKLSSVNYEGNDLAGENLKFENNTLSGLIYRNTRVSGFNTATGYYYAFVLKVNENQASENTTEFNILGVKEHKIFASSTNSGEYLVLVSLDAENPSSKITITVDLDGKDNNKFDETSLEISLNLEYQGESKANFEIDNIPTSEITELQNTFGYIKNPIYDNYVLDNLNFKNNVYVHTLNDVAFGKALATGYYLVFRVKPEIITEDITISIPCSTCKNGIKTLSKSDLVENGLTIIFRLNPEDTAKEIKVTIDYDGDKNTYLAKDYILSYQDVNFLANTNYSIDSIINDETAQNTFRSTFGFDLTDGYKTEFTTLNDTTTITGLLPIIDKLKAGVFDDEELTTYYLAYKIILENEGTNDTVIKINNAKVIQDSSNKKVYYVLKSLKNDENDFTITIDLDNEKKDTHNISYVAHTINVNVENLTRQQESKIEKIDVIANLEELNNNHKQLLSDANYVIPAKPLTLTNNNLTGDIYPLNLTENTIAKETHYYIPLLITLPENNKATIKVNLDNAKISDVIDNKVLILYALEETDEKEITIEVDLDGESFDYNSKTYTITYSDVVFKKEPNIRFSNTFTNIDTSLESILKENYNYELIGQAKLEYELNYEAQNNLIKAKGFIPYVYNVKGFEQEKQTNLYFPIVINVGDVDVKGNGIEKNIEITVPCQSGDSCINNKKIITNSSFDNKNEIVIFYRLDPEALKKELEITIDIDGQKGECYEPVSYTINYEELKTPIASNLSIDFTNIADRQDLQDHNYTIPTEEGYILNVDSSDSKNIKLSGKIKYQNNVSLFSGLEQTGFYFAFDLKDFKINDKINNNILVQVKGDVEKTIPYEKLSDNFETILFAINPETLKDCSNNKCQVEITVDLDGNDKYYAAEKYFIDYSAIILEKSVLSSLNKADSNSFDSYGYRVLDTYNFQDNKITGYLERQNINDEVFSNDNEEYGDYYLGLTLNFPEITKNMLIKITNTSGTEPTYLTYKNLEIDKTIDDQKLNILKLIDFSKDFKDFTITIDLDGCRDSDLPICQNIDDDNIIHYDEQVIKVDISELITLEEKVRQAYENVKNKESANFENISKVDIINNSYHDYDVKVHGSYDKDSYLFYIDYTDSNLADIVRYEYGVSGSAIYFDWSNTYKEQDGKYEYLGQWKHEESRDFNNAESLFKNTGIGILGHRGSNGIKAAKILEKDNNKFKIELIINKEEANYFFNDAFNYEKVYAMDNNSTVKLKTALNNKTDIIVKDVKAIITINDYENEELIDSIDLSFNSDVFSPDTIQALNFKSTITDFNKVVVDNPKDNVISNLN